jgi:hypothetical protein
MQHVERPADDFVLRLVPSPHRPDAMEDSAMPDVQQPPAPTALLCPTRHQALYAGQAAQSPLPAPHLHPRRVSSPILPSYREPRLAPGNSVLALGVTPSTHLSVAGVYRRQRPVPPRVSVNSPLPTKRRVAASLDESGLHVCYPASPAN